jgi:hypothetical protein
MGHASPLNEVEELPEENRQLRELVAKLSKLAVEMFGSNTDIPVLVCDAMGAILKQYVIEIGPLF